VWRLRGVWALYFFSIFQWYEWQREWGWEGGAGTSFLGEGVLELPLFNPLFVIHSGSVVMLVWVLVTVGVLVVSFG